MVAYGLAMFIGAFLLFLVQPLMGKFLLPWFGGVPAVWSACLFFFQALLLAGYGYAHLSTRLLKPRHQVLLHLALLVCALVTLPGIPAEASRRPASADPTLRIFAWLLGSVGLQYFVLSATAPLLQHWISRTRPRSTPYRLYALSNVGSLLALVSYPWLIESRLSRLSQVHLWGIGLVLYAVACGCCGWLIWRAPILPASEHSPQCVGSSKPGTMQIMLWFLFAATASVLLLAVTNKICQDIAVMPLLWVLPLALYLLSFVVCFERPQWYRRWWSGWALLGALVGMTAAQAEWLSMPAPAQVLVYTGGLFVCCLVAHGEIYRLRPPFAQLTSFYLSLASGGALGALFVVLVAPLIFSDFTELPVGIVVCGVLFLVQCARDQRTGASRPWPRPAWAASVFVWAAVALALWLDAHRFDKLRVERTRNFYGVLSVYRHRYPDSKLDLVELVHGRVAHGMQFLAPGRAGQPTLYYGTGSGVGRALQDPPAGNRRIGVIGLGAGTLAAYARPGDHFRFYEINGEVLRLARRHFTYLTNSPGDVCVVLGDARLSLEQEQPNDFDLLAVDAFNGDAIPTHLLTREAFAIYERHLRTNGVLALNISNMNLDLEPVVMGVAGELGLASAVIQQDESNEPQGVLPSTWVLLSRDPEVLDLPAIHLAARPGRSTGAETPLWTDDFSALFPTLRWGYLFGRTGSTALGLAPSTAAATKRGSMGGTVNHFRQLVAQNPDSAVALNNLACLLATGPEASLRDGREAVRLAEKACTLTDYKNPRVVCTLAAAYAEAGRFDEAIAAAEKACSLASEQHQQSLMQENRQLLELFRRRVPYHQSAR